MSSFDLDATRSFDPSRAEDLAEVLDALPSLVAYVDRHGINRYANAAATRWLRRPQESIVGSHARDLLTEEGYVAVQAQFEAALRGERQEFLRAMPSETGKVIYALTEYLPVLRDGHPDGFITMLTDVTARILAEREHEHESVRSAELEQRNAEAAQASDDVLQQLYAIGLHLDRLSRHPEQLEGQAAPVLASLQETVDQLRGSITKVLLGGEASSAVGVIRQLVAGWAERTGYLPAVVIEDDVDDLGAATTRHLLTALSQILATAARHETGPFRINIAAMDGCAVVTADGEDWPVVAQSEFGRMSTLVRDDGGSLDVDTTHPVLTRVTWRSASTPAP
ncbi:MAG: PAS domain-containing protein [Nocardioides sp.]